MPRANQVVNLVKAGSRGDRMAFERAVQAVIADERAKQHHVLADRLEAYLRQEHQTPTSTSDPEVQPFFYELSPERHLSDLTLPDWVRRSCDWLVEEQARSDLLRSYGIEPRNRVLLSGPPGTGKTSLAEALASELYLPLLAVRYEGVIGSYLGETSSRLSRLFEHVRTRRCVLFFDEFDTLGKERGDEHETGEIKRVVSNLLLQIDSLPSYVILVTATNHPELLDRAAWRRFQIVLELGLPTLAQRRTFLDQLSGRLDLPLGKGVSLIAREMVGSSFAEIEEVVLDIQRRRILRGIENDFTPVVAERLVEWRARRGVVREASRS